MKTIYATEPISFYKRLWQSAKIRLAFGFLLFVFIVVGMWQMHFLGIALLLPIYVCFGFPMQQSFKWTKRQIIKIEANDDIFNIHLLFKDERQSVIINKKELQMKLKWLRGREHILNLIFYKNDIQLFEIFSYGDGKKSEYQVEDIRYQVNQHIGYNAG
jgi:hypothetical protein